MSNNDGSYAIAGAFLVSAIILSATIIYAVGNLNTSLLQVKQGLADVKVGLANAPANGANTGTQQPAPTAVIPTQAPAPAATGKVDLAGAPTLGSKTAKYVLVEYSDFQCPFCERFYSQTELQLRKDYVDTGKIQFIYKHFPLDQLHPNARPAARAAECAKDQGKFWEYHDALFSTQQLDEAGFKKYAADLKLDTAKFNACLAADANKDTIINAQESEGISNGIQGTPGFVITDPTGKALTTISGAQPYDVFKQALASVGVA